MAAARQKDGTSKHMASITTTSIGNASIGSLKPIRRVANILGAETLLNICLQPKRETKALSKLPCTKYETSS